MQIETLYSIFLKHPEIQTDTRKLKAGEIFFALKGENFNGNTFARQALDIGAAYVVVDEDPGFNDDRIILTHNVLQTLQQLAKHHRSQFKIPFIAITGSNGKTTTKELIHAVLNTTYKTYTTQGNLNNHIGIPLTILRIKQDAEIAVIEMGANHQKEIAGYCTYTLPDFGLINNCGKAHLEGFGGVEGVRKGKGELYDFIRENGGSIFINWDYDYLREMSRGINNLITYGTTQASTTGELIKSNPLLEVLITSDKNIGVIKTQLAGEYNIPNVLAAVCVGKYFNVSSEKIKSAIEKYIPDNSRSQLIKKESNTILLDAYNANPTSMKAAIENMIQLNAAKKVLMLGAMAELGDDSLMEHQAILNLINNHPWHQVVLVGGDFLKLKNDFLLFQNSHEAAIWFKQQKFENTTILIKGSRSMKMEKVLE